jgi:hypothetical protein
MKTLIITLIIGCFASLSYAQDVLIRRNGDEIATKVLEITLSEIKYKRFDNLEGPTISILKSNVFLIKYENGTQEVFQNNLPENQEWQEQEEALTPEQMYARGQEDARIEFDRSEAMYWSFVSSLVPGWGLIGSAAIAAVPPTIYTGKITDPNYVQGYRKQAHRRKAGSAAIGAALGTATSFLTIMALLASQ